MKVVDSPRPARRLEEWRVGSDQFRTSKPSTQSQSEASGLTPSRRLNQAAIFIKSQAIPLITVDWEEQCMAMYLEFFPT